MCNAYLDYTCFALTEADIYPGSLIASPVNLADGRISSIPKHGPNGQPLCSICRAFISEPQPVTTVSTASSCVAVS